MQFGRDAVVAFVFNHTRGERKKPPPQHAIFETTLKTLVAGHADTDGTYLATADTF